MTIKVNGEAKEVSSGLTLHQLLLDLDIDPSRPGIAVAVDQEVVSRTQWLETVIPAESEIEIIRAAQGG